MKKTTKILFFSILTTLISIHASAVETFRHPTCNIYLHPFEKTQKYDGKLITKLKEKLAIKGYNLKDLNERKKLTPGEFHIKMKRTLFGKMYKECLIELTIKQARGEYAIERDPIFYKIEKKRKFPRQSFKGKERCLLALNDSFFALNICQSK